MAEQTHKSYRLASPIAPVARLRQVATIAVVLTILSSQALAQPAFPGAQGFGAETQHGRGGTVILVTNTNDSGPGSLRAALLTTSPRIIIFRVSGTIRLNSRIDLNEEHSNVYVAGQTAPGDGIAIRGPNEKAILSISRETYKEGVVTDSFHDGVFQHIRFRHGATGPATTAADNVQIHGGTYNTVFDHNSFTWSGDESVSIWMAGSGLTPPVRDLTFSHNIFGEGAVDNHNTSALFSGGSKIGNSIYNITMHHNLIIHAEYRNFKTDTGSGNSGRGIQYINNVHYNNSQDYSFGQNQYSGCSATVVDIIGDYFKAGPDRPQGAIPVYITRGANQPPPSGCSGHIPVDIHFIGSTWRDINGDPISGNNESNNYRLIDGQFGTETWNNRSAPITNQPQYPVRPTSYSRAYADVVINEDVGATMPALDSVDQRLVDDPEDGGGWSLSNIGPPNGSGSYPTLLTYNVPTDSDKDGVPDNYEATLGTNPNTFEEQAKLDHDGDGYTNIEEWIHSLPGGGNKPNPPIITAAN